MIAGPTATGKSEVAVEVATRLGGEIINADSVQLYKHCDVGSAKPSLESRRVVPHYLYDLLEPDTEFNAGEYEKLAETMVLSIGKRGKLPIVVGGTGLYIKALLWGLSIPTPKDPEVRDWLEKRWNSGEAGTMYQKLMQVDPEYVQKVSPKDRIRIVRALEILELTGKPPSHFARWKPKERFRPITIALDLPRETLKQRITERTERMVKEGLIEETQGILAMGYPQDSPPLRAIGYKQAVQHLQGLLSLEEAKREIEKATWGYSKRQRAWFKKEGFKWVDSSCLREAVGEIEKMIIK